MLESAVSTAARLRRCESYLVTLGDMWWGRLRNSGVRKMNLAANADIAETRRMQRLDRGAVNEWHLYIQALSEFSRGGAAR